MKEEESIHANSFFGFEKATTPTWMILIGRVETISGCVYKSGISVTSCPDEPMPEEFVT
jgi:hypothetical protein